MARSLLNSIILLCLNFGNLLADDSERRLVLLECIHTPQISKRFGCGILSVGL